MKYSDFKFKTADNQEIFVAGWAADKGKNPKAVLQIAHGMAEHIARYQRLAEYLTDNDYLVYGNDHRGHGKTAGILENVGFFAESDGFQRVVGDMIQLTGIIKQKHPGLPVFLLGHSMGSLLVRNYITRQGDAIQGAILSGSPGDPGLLGKVGYLIARLEARLRGKRTKSPLLDKLSFGKFNTAFKPNRTSFDWLSRDNGEVDKYVADPYCGTLFSAGFFCDLLSGLFETFDPASLKATPKTVPVFMISGEKDPVGGARKVENIYQSYLAAGLQDITLKIYPGARHELLNETNREEVFADLNQWLNNHLV